MKRKSVIAILFFALIFVPVQAKTNKKQVYLTMKSVADWQVDNFEQQVKKGSGYKNSHAYWAWTNGALYVGMYEWSTISKDAKYIDFLENIAKKVNYEPGPNEFHADDICVGQLYFRLYERDKDPIMIKPTLERMDMVLANRPIGNLDFSRPGNQNRWSWCDALFMAPAVYVSASRVTKDMKYIKFMNEEFRATYDTLYNKNEKLFFRDTSYKNRKEANGKNVFWGRGNGWVIGGLCQILEKMPVNYPDRPFYENLFKEMMSGIVQRQDPKGNWHASMLDPESYPNPETSASAFFTYGLAWGINHGLLPEKEYKPFALKAWNSLCQAVHPDGKLGFIQPIGADPKNVTFDMTEVYGVGAFLLAGSEMYKMK